LNRSDRDADLYRAISDPGCGRHVPNLPTVVVSVPHPLVSRDLLTSGVVREFVRRDWRVVILSPMAGDVAFRESTSEPNVEHAELPSDVGALARMNSKIRDLEFARNGTMSGYMTHLRKRTPANLILAALSHGSLTASVRRPLLRALNSRLEVRALERSEEIFERYRPSVLLVPSPGFRYEDQVLLRAARVYGVPTVSAVSSWDNLTGRGAMKVVPDVLSVWNEPMKRHAMQYHGFSADRVFVTGAPQFDVYTQRDRFWTRSRLCERLGVAPSRPLVTFLSGVGIFEAELHDVSEVVARCREHPSWRGRRPAFVVRVHPYEDPVRFSDLRADPDIVLDPDSSLFMSGTTGSRWADHDLERDVWKASLFLQSDAVWASCLTTALVEACVFDTPCFVLHQDRRRGVSPKTQALVAELTSYSHHADFRGTGALNVVPSIDGLTSGMAAAIETPDLRRAERAKAVELLCHRIDGGAARRLVELVEEHVSHVCS
jgi:hypothetical protein